MLYIVYWGKFKKTLVFILFFIATYYIPYTIYPAYADTPEQALGNVAAPSQVAAIGSGSEGIGNFVGNLIGIVYTVAAIVFLFMMIWGAFQWMTSGGEKEGIAAARKRLTYAIIGILLLAVTFFLAGIIGRLTGFTFFKGQLPK